MGAVTDRTPVTREDILAVAAQIFRRKGFHATSMQDIARAVHLQKASLYHHVSSKQEILLALLDWALDLLIASMHEVVSQPLSPEEKLRRAIEAYTAILAEHRDLAAVLLLEFRFLDPDLKARHIRRRDEFERLWREVVKEGQKAGDFHVDDVALAVRAILGMVNWLVMWYRPDGPLSTEVIAHQFSQLALEGLCHAECDGHAS
ncbi:MAG TPA: TetR/AcrR family transcriptional regulator [Anaerolineaceae bacterium]|nr:TetR/AcrR family transcriptional regulator [Anaerolineales bacterium]HIQ08620.1 TetR/AcrR family transcriptional regulator [Anaerolineaceae bacterium]